MEALARGSKALIAGSMGETQGNSANKRNTGQPRSINPPEKLLGDGLSTPVPLFCLICTIISNKTGILD